MDASTQAGVAASGPYSYNFPTEPTYAPQAQAPILPFTDTAAATNLNLFPQVLHAPQAASLELSSLYNPIPMMNTQAG